MNPKQRRLVQVGIAVAILMGLFPPWTDAFSFANESGQYGSQGPAGYSFILDPPTAEMFHTIKIDAARLLVTMGGRGVCGGGWPALLEPAGFA